MGEQAGTVHPFTVGQNLIQILAVGDDKVQGFQPAVTRHITEIQHTDFILFNIADDVRLGEIFGILMQELDQRVHAYFLLYVFFHNITCFI